MWIQYAIVARIGEGLHSYGTITAPNLSKEKEHYITLLRYVLWHHPCTPPPPQKNEMTSAYRAGKKILHLKKQALHIRSIPAFKQRCFMLNLFRLVWIHWSVRDRERERERERESLSVTQWFCKLGHCQRWEMKCTVSVYLSACRQYDPQSSQ